MPIETWETITGNENLLILAASPGDESIGCGGLIAQSCRRGRPPFVLVLTDGSGSTGPIAHRGPVGTAVHNRPLFSDQIHLSGPPGPPAICTIQPDQLAALRERRTRAAAAHLVLPAGRLLMAGLFEGTVPAEGPAFDAVVQGITMVMWARDCNVICPPLAAGGSADQVAAHRIALAVAAGSGVGILIYHLRPPANAPAYGWLLDIARDLPAKRAALAEHRLAFTNRAAHEVFLPATTA